MAINPDIRDQAYQFFIEESPDLLHLIETGLLTLRQDHSTTKIHSLMRSAHSLKGGSAGVGLDAIATLAHRLENIFKALYQETLATDTILESWLLQAYDCLRSPLMQQITTGNFDAAQALADAEPIFSQIEAYCGDALTQSESYIPSSTEMGVDMVQSIFEVDVAQGLEQIAAALSQPQADIFSELQIQAEVFAGFAEVLNLPNFGRIAQTVQTALDLHPEQAIAIAQLALTEFEQSRQAILAGDRTGGAAPSAALLHLISPEIDSSVTSTLLPTAPIAELDWVTEPEDNSGVAIQPDWQSTDILFEPALVEPALVEESLLESALVEPTLQGADPSSEAPLGHDLKPAEITDCLGSLELTTELGSETVISSETVTQPIEAFGDHEVVMQPIEAIGNETLIGNEAVTQPIEAIGDADATDRIDRFTATETAAPPELEPDSPNNVPDLLNQAAPATNMDSIIRSDIQRTFIPPQPVASKAAANLTVRVDSERLERMNNLVGELAVSRSSLSLQTDQLQRVIKELRHRFTRFQTRVTRLQSLSDQIQVLDQIFAVPDTARTDHQASHHTDNHIGSYTDRHSASPPHFSEAQHFSDPLRQFNPARLNSPIAFDALEMDRYGATHSQLQAILEELVQLEESVDDIALFTRQSSQTLGQQQQQLTQLRDELVWARMLPLSEVLNRFPRILRDLSVTYEKPVHLKLTGAEVLIDRAILEKLYDPLLHLLRNAFDHGIESPSLRQQVDKSEQGQIEICAFHRGNQTMIEVRDDGRGLDLEKIRERVQSIGWLSSEQVATLTPTQLINLIFEPGFSTAAQVSELSGRGFGLDVVRSQLQALQGGINVASAPGQGTTFTLTLPLTLTITQLIICLVGSLPIALPANSIEDILLPQPDQWQQSGPQRLLSWRGQRILVYPFSDLLQYTCPIPESIPSQISATFPAPRDWAAPIIIIHRDQQVFGLAIDRVLTEQELVIKPFGSAISPPNYLYGCTILGDGSPIPVVDAAALLVWTDEHSETGIEITDPGEFAPQIAQIPTILVVDDSIMLRRTLALFLEREGFRVLQAQNGQEAIDQLRHSSVQLVICDIEMPHMNGFEFLNARRQDPKLSEIPVMILTSRSNEKHRWLALQLGATEYMTKPYLEQPFLATLKMLLAAQPA